MSSRPPLPLLALALLAAACSPLEEVDPFERGREVTMVGAIELGAQATSDIRPRLLDLDLQSNTAIGQLGVALEARVPDLEVVQFDPLTRRARVRTPAGVSVLDAAAALGPDPLVLGVDLVLGDARSTEASLHSTSTTGRIGDAPRRAWLVPGDDVDLADVAFRRVVRVHGVQGAGSDPAIRVDRVEDLGPLVQTWVGVVQRHSGECLILERDDGELFQLVGDPVADLSLAVHLHGQRRPLQVMDAGINGSTCSGGYVAELVSY